MLPLVNRLLPAAVALVGAALLVIASLLPEFFAGGAGVTPLDPGRPAWVPSLVGLLVQVAIVLSAALMLLLEEPRQIAGGILVGAGLLGFSLRVVRLFQLAAAPELSGGDGSWVDLIAEGLVVLEGVLSLRDRSEAVLIDEVDEVAEDETLPPLAPPPGEPREG